MTRLLPLCAAALIVAGHAATAAGQTPIVPTRVEKEIPDPESPGKMKRLKKVTVETEFLQHPDVENEEHPVAALTRIYQSGNGRRLNALAIEIIRTVSCTEGFFDLTAPTLPGGQGTPCRGSQARRGLDLSRDFVALVWSGPDFSGKRVVHRIVVRDDVSDPYSVTLPGLDADTAGVGFYELFLSADESAEHSSLYLLTPQADPLEAQLPGFVAATTGPLFTTLGKQFGTFDLGLLKNRTDQVALMSVQQESSVVAKALLAEKPKITAQLGYVRFPQERAKIKTSDVVRQAIPVSEFLKQTQELGSRLKLVEARESSCAKNAADAFVLSASKASGSPACVAASTTAQKCRDEFDAAFKNDAKKVAEGCPAGVRAEAVKENEARPVEKKFNTAQLEADVEKRLETSLKAVQQVDGEFRKLVATQQPERLTGEGALTNTPLTRWSFGALTSFVLTASSNEPRVKVGNDGKLAADPLGRQMTLVVVNFAPKGYDPEQRPMSMAERVRPFAGVVATPDFGIGAGISVGIWKGVGVNFGGALLFLPSLRGDDEIGAPPSDPNDSFGATLGKALFIGASYNFK